MKNNSKSEIFVDASALIALFLADDPHHYKAVKFVKLLEKNTVLSTVNLVYFESMTIISQKAGLAAARQFRDYYWKIPFKFYEIGSNQIQKAERLLFSQKSKNVPFFDCLYAALVKDKSISQIFTYDRDFRKLGIKTVG